VESQRAPFHALKKARPRDRDRRGKGADWGAEGLGKKKAKKKMNVSLSRRREGKKDERSYGRPLSRKKKRNEK